MAQQSLSSAAAYGELPTHMHSTYHLPIIQCIYDHTNANSHQGADGFGRRGPQSRPDPKESFKNFSQKNPKRILRANFKTPVSLQ